jgi:hypothetical protein
MTSKSKFRPSPAMAISCVALFLALVGTAFAAPQIAVRSAQIVNGTIRTADLGRDAVKSPKIADATVSSADLGPDSVGSEEVAKDAIGPEEIAENAVASPEVAPDSLTAADLAANSVDSSEVVDQSLAKADLGTDSVGASELGTVTVRTNATAIANGANGGVNVTCAAGEQVLGGGGQPAHFGVEMTSSRPSGNGWLYQARNNSGSNSTLTVYAVCLAV